MNILLDLVFVLARLRAGPVRHNSVSQRTGATWEPEAKENRALLGTLIDRTSHVLNEVQNVSKSSTLTRAQNDCI